MFAVLLASAALATATPPRPADEPIFCFGIVYPGCWGYVPPAPPPPKPGKGPKPK
jgi:hypothetical protein